MVGGRTKAYLAAMLHAGGLAWATAVVAVGKTARPARLNCFSLLRDDRVAATSDHRWRLIPHPDDLPEFVPGASPAALVKWHLARIETPGTWPVRVTKDELPGILLRREQRHVDHSVGRGVYVPMTPEEVEGLTGEAAW